MSAWNIDNQSYDGWNTQHLQDSNEWAEEASVTMFWYEENGRIMYLELLEDGIYVASEEKSFPEDTHFFNLEVWSKGGCSYVNSEEFHVCKSCHETNGRIDIEELTEDLPPDDYYQRSYIVEGNRIIINFLSLESINITLTWEWDGSTFKLNKA